MGYWAPQVVQITRKSVTKYMHGDIHGGVIESMTFTGEGLLYFARIALDNVGVTGTHNQAPFVATENNFRGWKDVDGGASIGTSFSSLNAWTNNADSLRWQRLIAYTVNGLCAVEYVYPNGLPFKSKLEIGVSGTAGDTFTLWVEIEGFEGTITFT